MWFFNGVLRRRYLSKDLKNVREEVFWGRMVQTKGPKREKSRVCPVSLEVSGRKRWHRGDGDKAVWLWAIARALVGAIGNRQMI